MINEVKIDCSHKVVALGGLQIGEAFQICNAAQVGTQISSEKLKEYTVANLRGFVIGGDKTNVSYLALYKEGPIVQITPVFTPVVRLELTEVRFEVAD